MQTTPAGPLQPSAAMENLVITAIGPDRPGIVGGLTSSLASAGANLLDTRMVNLRGQFAMMVLLECPTTALDSLQRSLPELGSQMALTLTVSRPPGGNPAVGGLRFRLKTYSLDRPGIVAMLSTLLREHGVNIEELKAWQESAAFSGGALFLTEMQITLPESLPVRTLRTDLEHLCNDLNCDVDLEPA